MALPVRKSLELRHPADRIDLEDKLAPHFPTRGVSVEEIRPPWDGKGRIPSWSAVSFVAKGGRWEPHCVLVDEILREAGLTDLFVEIGALTSAR